MNEIAQKRINDYREKIALSIANCLGADISESTRARLVNLLANTRLPKYEGTVFSFLQNHSDYEDAIIAGCKYENNKIEDFLFEKLFDARSAHRDIIAEQLGLKKNPAAVEKFAQLLADEDRQVRFQAAHALFNIGGKDAALAMCEYISDPDEWISMTILRLLCIMREHESIPILAEKFHQDDDLRRKALMVSFLARFKSVTLIKIFDEGIKARDARLKANSIEAIGGLNLPDKDIRARVEPFLHDPNNRIRANTILVLARSAPELVRPEIKEMVESNDVQLRRSAAFLLTMIPSEGYEELAAKLIVDQNVAVRNRMVQSLKNFPSEFVSEQLQKAINDEDKWIRKHALDMAARISSFPTEKVLGLLKTERAAPNLEACMNFFASHPVSEALSPIKLHVKDRRHQVVKSLLNAVVAINGIEGIKAIAPRLDQRDPKVICLLTEVLVKAGERKILEDLIEKFAQTKKEQQVVNLIASVEKCLEVLALGDNIPVPLMQSLEKIDVVEKPESATLPPEEFHEPHEVEVGVAKSVDDLEGADALLADDQELILPIDSYDDASGMELPALDLGGQQPKPKKKKKQKSPHYIKGMKAYNLGKFNRSVKEFNALIESGEKVPDKVYLYMGIMHAENSKYEHARAFFETFLKKNPDNPKANYLYGKVLKELKNWNGLIETYSRFTDGEIDASPKLKKAIYRELGIANVLLGKYERGFQLLAALHKVQSDNPEVGYYMALAQFHLHKPSAAAALLNEVIQHAGNNKRIAKLAEALSTKVRSGGGRED
jgi:HEAT repeat protein